MDYVRLTIFIEVRDAVTPDLRTFARFVEPPDKVARLLNAWPPDSAERKALLRIDQGEPAVNCWQCRPIRCRDLSSNVYRRVSDLTNLDGTPFRVEQLEEAKENVRRLQRQLSPPPGYVPYKVKHAPKGKDGIAQEICPNCGEIFYGCFITRWEDERPRRAYEEAEEKGISIAGGLNPVVLVDNQPLLSHWSRVEVGECYNCGAQTWAPLSGYLGRWYKPTPVKGKVVQLGLL